MGSVTIIGGNLNGDLGSPGGPRGRRDPSRHGFLLNDFNKRYNLYASNLAEDAIGPLETHRGPT